ncbi:hypothetical protein NQZ68_029091 [Dissostichus eleginoides]|nr:hypothetical protein NQZ68_029091 [Dissostichus eleginoides]
MKNKLKPEAPIAEQRKGLPAPPCARGEYLGAVRPGEQQQVHQAGQRQDQRQDQRQEGLLLYAKSLQLEMKPASEEAKYWATP